MSQKMDLKAIERKAFRSYYEDGLWDLFLGLILMAMGVMAGLSKLGASGPLQYGVFIGLEALILLSFIAGKKYITTPRIGHVKFGEKGKARKRNTRIVLAASVLFGVVVFVLSVMAFRSDWKDGLPMHIIFPAVYVLNMVVVFGLMAHFLAYDRLFLIGVLFAIPVPIDMALKRLAGINIAYLTFAIPGIAIVAMGLVTFTRFLRENLLPVVSDPTADR